MKVVSAREANQHFSRILGQVENGEAVVITRRGKPVAEIRPFQGSLLTPERKAAAEELFAMLEKGLPLGGRKFTRDEMHER